MPKHTYPWRFPSIGWLPGRARSKRVRRNAPATLKVGSDKCKLHGLHSVKKDAKQVCVGVRKWGWTCRVVTARDLTKKQQSKLPLKHRYLTYTCGKDPKQVAAAEKVVAEKKARKAAAKKAAAKKAKAAGR